LPQGSGILILTFFEKHFILKDSEKKAKDVKE